ncbi:hypothetical protein UlMin_044676 [Ulmus minor]
MGRKGGLILLWKSLVAVEIKSSSSGHIDAIVSHDHWCWRFTGFYGNLVTEQRKFSWQLLVKLGSIPELSHLPWLVGGDFNEILFDSEKRGGRPRMFQQMRDFQESLVLCGHKDLSFSGEQFTLANKQDETTFIQSSWASGENNFEARVVADRLADCAVKTDKWGFQKYGKMGSEIARLQKEVEAKKSDCLFAPCIREISDMEKRLEELHARDEIYWKQRSRMEWLAHGDRNSKKIHLKASERKRKSGIKGLFNSSG